MVRRSKDVKCNNMNSSVSIDSSNEGEIKLVAINRRQQQKQKQQSLFSSFSSSLETLENIVCFEPNAVIVGDQEWIQVTFAPNTVIPYKLILLGVEVALVHRDSELTKRWFKSSLLPVGEYSNSSGAKLIVFEVGDEPMGRECTIF